jgi:hypothetical protein
MMPARAFGSDFGLGSGWFGIVCNPTGTRGREIIDVSAVSARGGNAASNGRGAGGEGIAVPGLPCAPVTCGAGGGGGAVASGACAACGGAGAACESVGAACGAGGRGAASMPAPPIASDATKA